MGEYRSYIDAAVVSSLEEHKQKNGRKFSTMMEGYGYTKAQFDGTMHAMKSVANLIDFLWSKTMDGELDEDYKQALDATQEYGREAIEELITMVAMLEKLKGGVVHDKKS